MWVEAKIRTEIKAAIVVLSELEKKAFGPHHRKVEFYRYLAGVFSLYRKWKEAGVSKKRAEQLVSIYEGKQRKAKEAKKIPASKASTLVTGGLLSLGKPVRSDFQIQIVPSKRQ